MFNPFKTKKRKNDETFHYVISMDFTINWTTKDKNGKVCQSGEKSVTTYVLMENDLGERICKTSEPQDDNYIYKHYSSRYEYNKLTKDKKTAYKDTALYKKTIFTWLNGGKLDEPWASKARNREKELRQKHPGLQELWDKYQSFLILCKEKKDFEEENE